MIKKSSLAYVAGLADNLNGLEDKRREAGWASEFHERSDPVVGIEHLAEAVAHLRRGH